MDLPLGGELRNGSDAPELAGGEGESGGRDTRVGVGPLLRRGLSRVRATPPQAALPWTERAKNVRGAFLCELDLSGLTVALVDDVMTTGASLAEAARVLKGSGAASVENWVVARTPPPAAG